MKTTISHSLIVVEIVSSNVIYRCVPLRSPFIPKYNNSLRSHCVIRLLQPHNNHQIPSSLRSPHYSSLRSPLLDFFNVLYRFLLLFHFSIKVIKLKNCRRFTHQNCAYQISIKDEYKQYFASLILSSSIFDLTKFCSKL